MNRELLQQALDALLHSDSPSQKRADAITALKQALAAPQPEPVALCDALRWSGAKESHGAMMFSPNQLRKFYEFASRAAPPAAPAPAVPDGAVLYCGHPASLAVKSAETGKTLYCDLCDAKSGRRDAEQMEAELREENLRLREAAESVAPVVPLTDADIDRIADAVPVDDIGVHITTWHRRFARAVLSAAPAVREPLTDEQIDALWSSPMSADWEHREFARAIEAHHGIGGGGK